ncbi:MAG: hypothetical protein P1U83_06465 [Roseovarius sp.]|nr:hypothetical protein [Roseovarius sp.]
MSTQGLKTRLEVLKQQMRKDETRLKDKGLMSDDHAQTGSDLQHRDILADAGAHGHHVSDAEKSDRGWLDALGLCMG